MIYKRGIKSGFTLIELLVVVTILGLLAIVVLPAFTAGGDKRLLRGAADRLDTHLKHAAARATGKPRGAAVLLQPDVGTAVLDLEFARIPTGSRMNDLGQYRVQPYPGDSDASTKYIDVNKSTKGLDGTNNNQGFSLDDEGAFIRIENSANEYVIDEVTFPSAVISRAKIVFAAGSNEYNTTFPNKVGPFSFTVLDQPSGAELTKRPTVLPDRVCVDLAASTIGVYAFGDALGGDSPLVLSEILSPAERIIICFDVFGKAVEVLARNSATASRIALTPGKPIALLCTLAYQSGASQVAYPTTEESPGAGWQKPDAFWVVIDPKTGRNVIVQNYFEPTSPQEAQTFIRNDLLAQ
jgi:prepilin-type N-terminal cleavage/methylation domain-containing protein